MHAANVDPVRGIVVGDGRAVHACGREREVVEARLEVRDVVAIGLTEVGEHERVPAGATGQGIVPQPAIELVSASAALQGVVASEPFEDIIPRTALQDVVTGRSGLGDARGGGGRRRWTGGRWCGRW
jgi:hypothetical protein